MRWSWLVLVMFGAVAQAKPEYAFTPDYEPITPPPNTEKPKKALGVSTVYPSIVPGTFLIQQRIYSQPGEVLVCYYLVRGSIDPNKSGVLEAVSAENVMQFNCSNEAKR